MMKLLPEAIDTAFLEGKTQTIGYNDDMSVCLRYRPGGAMISAEEWHFLTTYLSKFADYETCRMVHSVLHTNSNTDVSGYASFHITPDNECRLTLCGVMPHLREQGIARETLTATLQVLKRVQGDSCTEIGFTFLEGVPDRFQQSLLRLVEESGLSVRER